MHDITNEQYLAGCILLEGSVVWGLVDLVKADDFQNEYCKAIYVAAQQVAADGGVVDVVSVRTRAARNGVDLPISYLTELVEITPTAANFAVYAERVAEDGRTRRIKDLAERIQYDTTSTSAELLECLQKERIT